MRLFETTVIALIASAALANAESKITMLCGADHANELVSQVDVQANPDGYFIRGLNIQISHGDPRLIQAVGEEFHLCTRAAATPDMPTTMAHQLTNERAVMYLFVPNPNPQNDQPRT